MTGVSKSKRKNEKEDVSEDQTAHIHHKIRQKRTKYQITPSNGLASSTPLKILKIDQNIPNDQRNEEAILLDTPKKPLGLNIDIPSSQDHVYWAPTPRANASFKLNSNSAEKMPSSPITENISINPIISLPQKYASLNYDNLGSQASPEFKRIDTRQDNSGSIKKLFSFRSLRSSSHLTTPISEKPAKLKDIASLINTVENEFGPKSSKSIFNNCLLNDELTPSKTPEVNSDAIFHDIPKSENSSDIFDDSEDFLDELDKAIDRRTQSLPTRTQVLQETESTESLESVTTKLSQNKISSEESTKPIPNKHQAASHANIIDDISFDSDFDDSDDDLMDKLIDEKVSQLPSHPPSTLKLTTQEKIDIAGQMVFKKDIDNTDINAPKAFKTGNEDLTKVAFQRENVHRFQIVKIIDSFFTTNGRKIPQKILQVVDYTKIPQNIIIRDMWLKLDLEIGGVINIVGKNYKLVDKNSDNLLILNPDILLSATLIGDTINCPRRSALKAKVDQRGNYSMALIVGEIVHIIFQSVLREGNSSTKFMNERLEDILNEYLMTILSINESKETIREQVRNHLPYINTFFLQYAKKSPDAAPSVKTYERKSNKSLFAASNIIDIEENIWSPIYGIKGMIDVTIEASLRNDANDGKFIVPMELKSGSKRIEHEAQTALYTLLMKDRYDLDINFFMLVYTKIKETTKHEINKLHLKDLVVSRNQLSTFLKEGLRTLPELKRDGTCDRCFYTDECMTINKLMEDGTSEGSGLVGDRYNQITGHLDKSIYKEFYNYWDELITKEEGTLNLLKKQLFLIDSETREKNSGKCISNLVLRESDDGEKGTDKYIYTFIRSKQSPFTALTGIQMSRHDRVIVSDEHGHFALCQGRVVTVKPDRIVIETTRRLKNSNLKKSDFNFANNQTFETVLKPLENSQNVDYDITYRIDKDEMFHGMKLARSNLLNLFLPDGDARRRSLVVDGAKPLFHKKPLHYKLENNHTFNSDQITAFNKVLSAKDYALLLGMPGTGKTTVIAQLIRFLVNNGKTVLLTSYTHSAVDNILIKMKDDDFGILRLGAVSRIHPEVQKFSPLLKDISTVNELNKVYLRPPVVATTCLGISDWIFNKRNFDYCIVDESSQVSMPVCLGPLSLCDKFILVGDHYQLPPLVQNPEANGLTKSLFKTLSETAPESVVELTYQYRMCNDIMLLSNTIIYEGRLKCGTQAIANQVLDIPNISNLKSSINEKYVNSENNWMETVLDPNRRVIFLNHDDVNDCKELSNRENIQNPKEAELIRQIVEAMLLCGIKQSQIGVMSFYRAQLRLFHKAFQERPEIEKLTADQFQGRDKDCVIISLVRSNDARDPGSLLKEWRRVNVAITRAKSKLIIVGSKSTLQSLKTIDAFMNILASRGWFYNLPKNADLVYSLESPVGPTTEAKSPNKVTKSVLDSKVLKRNQIAQNIAHEMGL